MVEYVLGGSPTNKESPLSALGPRLTALKFDESDKVTYFMPHFTKFFLIFVFFFESQNNDDKDKGSSPFDHTNGLKKPDDQNVVSIVNGIDDDKSFK